MGHTDSWKYYNSIEGFIPYFYKKVIAGTDYEKYRSGRGRKKIISDEEILTWYNSDLDLKDYIDSQYVIRKKVTNTEQARRSFICFQKRLGIWAMDPIAKKEAERIGGTNAIKKRKEDPIKWAESLKPCQIAGGKVMGQIQGKKNKESGHWENCIKLGYIASSKAQKELTKKKREEILLHISDQWITRKSVCDWFMQSKYLKEFGLESTQFIDNLLNDEEYFKGSGNGKNKRYVKTSSKFANQPGDPISRLEYIISENFKDTTFKLNDLEIFYDNFKDILDPMQWMRNKLKDSTRYKNLGQLGTGRGGGPFTYMLK